MIKYLGSKRTLLPLIARVVGALPRASTCVDLFSGTSRVGHALKQAGYCVTSNDHNAYAATLARAYIQADLEEVERDARSLIAEFNAIRPAAGYFTETFCEKSRFFQPKNGARIDAIREEIAKKALPSELEAVLLVSLMEAADRVDSTCGVQMAYLKGWALRANNDLELRFPSILPRSKHGKSRALQLDAREAVRAVESDVLYLDPPYNQHSYLGNYHVWESLVLWDKPEVYGIACKRVDCRERKSEFNFKPKFNDAFADVVRSAKARLIVVSFNNEGYIERAAMERLLAERGTVSVIATDYKRYVGAQIGIYNPSGRLVGEVSHLRNIEYIYLVDTHDSGVDWSSIAERLSDPQAQAVIARETPTRAAPPRRAIDPKLVADLANLLLQRSRLTSGDAQEALQADATLIRAAFKQLLSDGRCVTEGERRGTVYVAATLDEVAPPSDNVKAVKSREQLSLL